MANNPYVNKVIYGNQTLLDLTNDNIVANKLLSGKTVHDKSGNQITGTYDFATATSANAIASDVTEGKTGWANGVQIIGTKISVPTWADGTDAEIAEALTRHYNNEIDLTDYWTVGDERVVRLSAIEATSDYDAQPAQDITLVLVNAGGRTLTTPINGHTECAFVVGQKDCLDTVGRFYFDSINDVFGWMTRSKDSSDIRTWLNSNYINALPATLSGIFKSHAILYCDRYNSATVSTDNSIVGLPARKEIFGTDETYDKASSKYNQLTYYQDSSNRIKKVSGSASTYWTNSKYYYTGSTTSLRRRIYTVSETATQAFNISTSLSGIAPQMVI